MYDDTTDLNSKLEFWFERPAAYFIPQLPPNLEAAVIVAVRREVQRAADMAAFNRRMERLIPWHKRVWRWLNR